MNLINLTLSTTRKSLYISILTGVIFLILLPWSILSYLRFYSILIPNASYKLPIQVKSHATNDFGFNMNRPGPTKTLITANAVELAKVLEQDQYVLPKLSYDLVLDVQIYCPKLLVGDTTLVFGELLWQNKTMTTNEKSFLLHCDPRIIFKSFNWLVPYNLRLWVPPFLTTSERLNIVSAKIGHYSDLEIFTNLLSPTGYLHLAINYAFDTPLLIDEDNSFIHVNVEWRGVRYYIFYYYYSCFVLGVLLSWVVSSSVCVGVSVGVWFYLRNLSKKKAD